MWMTFFGRPDFICIKLQYFWHRKYRNGSSKNKKMLTAYPVRMFITAHPGFSFSNEANSTKRKKSGNQKVFHIASCSGAIFCLTIISGKKNRFLKFYKSVPIYIFIKSCTSSLKTFVSFHRMELMNTLVKVRYKSSTLKV